MPKRYIDENHFSVLLEILIEVNSQDPPRARGMFSSYYSIMKSMTPRGEHEALAEELRPLYEVAFSSGRAA